MKETEILLGYRSDHSFIALDLEFKKVEKYKNFWKFNSSLLKDDKCTKQIKETINKVKIQYAAHVYNIDEIEKIPNEELQLTISDNLFLDVLLMEIRSTIICFAINKKKNDKDEEIDLEKDIQKLENKCNKTLDDIQSLNYKKNELQEMRKEKIEGMLIRSKARYAAQGEKNN